MANSAVYSLLWIAVILGAAITARAIQRTWMAPGPWFTLVWVIAAVLPALTTPHAVSTTSLMLVALFCASALAGSIVGCADFKITSRRHEGAIRRKLIMDIAQPGFLFVSAALFGAGGLVAFGWYVGNFGASLSDLANGETWFRMAAHYSVERYFGGFVEPIWIRVLLAMNYSGAMLAGLAMRLHGSRTSRTIVVLPVVAGTLVSIVTTAKAPMLVSALFMLSGWIAGDASEQGGRHRRRVAWWVIAPVVFVAATGSMLLRYGQDEEHPVALIVERSSSYLFGHMAALSAWLEWEDGMQGSMSLGKETFAGAAELLKLRTRDAGVYSAIPLTDAAAESNVFTAFRGLIMDFTLPGALLLVAFVSTIAGAAWSRQRTDRSGPVGWLVLTVFYAFVGWSPVISLFVYNVVILAIVLTLSVLLVSQLVQANHRRQLPHNVLP